MTTHYNAGAKDPRLASCGTRTDSFDGAPTFTCKRCRAVLNAANRRARRDASARLFAVLSTLHVFGRDGLAEEVRLLAVDLHNGTAKRAPIATVVERMFPMVT